MLAVPPHPPRFSPSERVPVVKAIRLSVAVAKFLEWAGRNNAPRTVDGYQRYLRRFVAWAGDVPLATLTPAMLGTWSRKYHPIQAVQRLCSWIVRDAKLMAANPLAGMPKPKSGKRRRTFAPRESAWMLRTADRRFRRLLVFLRESMARPQEVRVVAWPDLRSKNGDGFDAAELTSGRAWFAFPDAKGYARRSDPDADRVIPISPRLGRLLVRLHGEGAHDAGPIFRNRFQRPWTANAIRCRVRRLRAAVGLSSDRRGENVVAYTFRHTAATQAVAAHVGLFVVQESLGHASIKTTQRYVHLTPDQLCKGMGKVWEAKRPANRPPKTG